MKRYTLPRLAALLLPLLLAFPGLQAYQPSGPIVVDVGPDGYAVVTHTYIVGAEEAPLQITVKILVDQPDYVYATLNGTGGILVEESAGQVILTVPAPGTLELAYGTYKLTSKTGDVWSITLEAPSDTRIVLPEDAIVINVEGNLADAGKTQDGRDYLEFSAGPVKIEYLRAPAPTTTTTTATTTTTTTTTPISTGTPPTTTTTTTTTTSEEGIGLGKILAGALVAVAVVVGLFFLAKKKGG